MNSLPPKQKQVLNLVEQFWQKHGMAPSIQETADALGVMKATAYKHLKILKQKGFLKHRPGVGHSWQSSRRIESSLSVPLLGTVAAGQPLFAVENIEDQIVVQDPSQTENCFALRVKGQSMMDGGILENDIVIVRQQPSAHDGDIVVALVDGESATVKKFKRFTSQIGLMPMNSNYEPIILDPERVSILGKVIEVRRWLERPLLRSPSYAYGV